MLDMDAKQEGTSEALKKKLFPRRFPSMSGQMAAIVGFVLGEQYTDPEIAELQVTSDGGVLARHRGDFGCNDFIGAEVDLQNNWIRLLDAAGLTTEERNEAQQLWRRRVRAWGRDEYEAPGLADPAEVEEIAKKTSLQ